MLQQSSRCFSIFFFILHSSSSLVLCCRPLSMRPMQQTHNIFSMDRFIHSNYSIRELNTRSNFSIFFFVAFINDRFLPRNEMIIMILPGFLLRCRHFAHVRLCVCVEHGIIQIIMHVSYSSIILFDICTNKFTEWVVHGMAEKFTLYQISYTSHHPQIISLWYVIDTARISQFFGNICAPDNNTVPHIMTNACDPLNMIVSMTFGSYFSFVRMVALLQCTNTEPSIQLWNLLL